MASMKDPEPPEGGTDDPSVITVPLGLGIPVASGRDAQTDSNTQADGRDMDDELDHSGYQVVTGAGTLGGEKRMYGWEKTTVPSGAPPLPRSTAGSRGASDIGKM